MWVSARSSYQHLGSTGGGRRKWLNFEVNDTGQFGLQTNGNDTPVHLR
jgi:hypothetical protein